MPSLIKKYKAAAVQAEPGWFNLEESIKKTVHWTTEAGAAGCKLVAFPEVWIPGYPYWMWKNNYQESLPFMKSYREHSLPSDSDEMRRIREAARENGIYVSLGYSEIDVATLHLAQALISPTGDVIDHRRKIKPTHVEKLVFGDGAGDTFEPVTQTDIGKVHVAAWPIYPGKTTLNYPDPYTNVSDPNSDIVSPAYAIETCTYVLAPFQKLSQEGVLKNTPPNRHEEAETPDYYNGHIRIYGPDGTLLAKPDKDFEGLVSVYALADFGGHYMRSELIRLLVDTRRKEPITHADQDGALGSYNTMDRFGSYNTMDRVGLSQPLAMCKEAVKGVSQKVPPIKSGSEKQNGFQTSLNGVHT